MLGLSGAGLVWRSNPGLLMRTLILLSILIASSTVARSQLPLPSARGGVKHENASASQPTKSAANEARGTEADPLFIRSIAAPESSDDAKHKEYERHEKPSLDRRLTIGTELLAAFTFFLFVFTAGLFWVTYKLSREAKKGSETQELNMQDSIAEAARDPLHNSCESVAAGSGWAARRLFAVNSPAIDKKNNAADRPSPADQRPQGVMQWVPSFPGAAQSGIDMKNHDEIHEYQRLMRVIQKPLELDSDLFLQVSCPPCVELSLLP